MRNRPAFTLIELMISITLMLLVFGAAVPFFRTQTRAVDQQAARWDALYTAQYSTNAMDREIRVAGTGVLPNQPLIVQADSMAITFNGDLVTRTKTDASAVYYDPDALINTVQALQPASWIYLPGTAKRYPDSAYVQTTGIPGSAETISYWLTRDSTTARTDDWLLMRRANNGTARPIARSLLMTPGVRPFRYFTVDSLEKTFEIPASRMPLIHTAPIHGAPADTGKSLQADSIRIVKIQFTAAHRGPNGVDIKQTVETTIRIVNAGLVGRATCGQPPIFGSAVAAVSVNTGAPQVTLTWGPALDENGGEADVERYVLYRRRPADPFTEPFAGVVAGEASYSFVDTDIVENDQWIYGVAAQDCTPSASGVVTSVMVTVPPAPVVIEPPPPLIPPLLPPLLFN